MTKWLPSASCCHARAAPVTIGAPRLQCRLGRDMAASLNSVASLPLCALNFSTISSPPGDSCAGNPYRADRPVRSRRRLRVQPYSCPGTQSRPPRGRSCWLHGAGVRANLFRAPVERTIVDHLIDCGYDVWLENWRASIDLKPNTWNLDKAAVYDHPARGAKGRRGNRLGQDQGRHPLPGFHQLHDVGRGRPGPPGHHHRQQRGLAAPRRAGVQPLQDHQAAPACSRAQVEYLNPQWGLHAPTRDLEDRGHHGGVRPSRVQQSRSARASASPMAPGSRRCGATRTSTTPPTSGSSRSSRSAHHLLRADGSLHRSRPPGFGGRPARAARRTSSRRSPPPPPASPSSPA